MRGIFVACAIALCPVPAVGRTQPDAWFGTWKLRLKTPDEKPETLVYSDAGNGAMRMHSVEDDSVIVTRWDGKPVRDTGSHGTGKPVLAVRATSPTSYEWTFFRAGKPYVRGVNTLAADRRTFMETSWRIAQPDKLVTLIYDRQ